jgi:leucyl/phenylalanyl-tRNA--protein transferase
MHSVEVWQGDDLVAGLIGCGVGKVFAMDSAFTLRSNGVKAAVWALSERLAGKGVNLLDAQVSSDLAVGIGAIPLPRDEFIKIVTASACRYQIEGGARAISPPSYSDRYQMATTQSSAL